MMKKYVSISIILFQLTCIFPAEKKDKRVSDPKKDRQALTSSNPIPIVSAKKDYEKRLSQSSPNLLQAYSYSPNEYYGFGHLGEKFSPSMYDSNR